MKKKKNNNKKMSIKRKHLAAHVFSYVLDMNMRKRSSDSCMVYKYIKVFIDSDKKINAVFVNVIFPLTQKKLKFFT